MEHNITPGLNWIKSSLSFANGNCVEVAFADDGETVAVRNSRAPGDGTLEFTRDEWQAFLGGVVGGEFELPRRVGSSASSQ